MSQMSKLFDDSDEGGGPEKISSWTLQFVGEVYPIWPIYLLCDRIVEYI